MNSFTLLNHNSSSLLDQLAKKAPLQKNKGIHMLLPSEVSQSIDILEDFIRSCEQNDLQHLVWIVPAIKNNNTLKKTEARLKGMAEFVSIIYYPPLLEFLYLHEEQIKEMRVFEFPFEKMGWSDLDAMIDAIKSVQPGQNLYLPKRILKTKKLIEKLEHSLVKAKENDSFLRHQFEKIDKNQDGRLDVDEVYTLLVKLGFSKTEVEGLVAATDTNNDGELSYEEFQTNLGQDLQKMLENVETGISHTLNLKSDFEHFLRTERGFDATAAKTMVEWMEAESIATDEKEVPTHDLFELWLNDNAISFLGVEVIPGKGLFTQRKSMVNGESIIKTTLFYPDGESLFIERKTDFVQVQWGKGELSSTTQNIEIRQKEYSVSVRFKEDKICSINVEGKWPALPVAMEKILFQVSVKSWERSILKEMGTFTLEDPATNAPDRLVCNCMSLCQKDFHPYIQAGVKELSTLVEKTNATTICGGCEPLVEALCGMASMSLAVLEKKNETENKDIKTLVLKPVEGTVKSFSPGQHIVLQAYVQNQWVTRAYSLISSGQTEDHYEIAVKREELGTLSRWLNDHADDNSIIRVSEPKGNYHLEDGHQEIVFFAAGIGVTPALSMFRTLVAMGDSRPFQLDWSAPYDKNFILNKEFGEYAKQSHFEINYRATRTQGRVSKTTLEKKYPYRPGKVAFLCGPEAFMNQIQDFLHQTGWPKEAINVEHFNAQVDSEGELLEAPVTAPVEHKKCPVKKESDVVESESFFIQPIKDISYEAELFIKQFYSEKDLSSTALNQRLEEVQKEINTTGSYRHTADELVFASRVAWRNSTRCVGRYFWGNMIFRDCRSITEEKEVFESLVEHLRIGINEGNLRAVISIFRDHSPLIRLYNPLLLMFAGYVQDDGSILGDPASVELTKIALKLGWQPKGEKSRFDPLPLVLEIDGRPPQWFDWPEDLTRTIPISHPELEWFAALDLKWFMVPAVAGMALDAGGIQYRCAPSNGFFISTEVGARDLGDISRYNMLPVIAEKMGLDMTSDETHWKDRAVVELNLAVQWSYRQHKIRMLDHHTIVEYFMKFHGDEKSAGRPVHGDWKWIVPPISGSTVEVFHMDMVNKILKPNYFYQEDAWKTNDWRSLSKV